MDEKLDTLINSFSKKALIDFLYYKNLEVTERQIEAYNDDKFTDGEELGEIDLSGRDNFAIRLPLRLDDLGPQ